MTPADARFIGDVRRVLHAASLERLYYLVQSIHHELVARDLPCRTEAAALELALLVDVDGLRRAIYSTDCSDVGRQALADRVQAAYFAERGAPPRNES